MSQVKELVYHIACSLVDHPEEIAVREVEKDQHIVMEITAHPSDLGKIIGRGGRIAKAIRTVAKAASSHEEKKVVVEIL